MKIFDFNHKDFKKHTLGVQTLIYTVKKYNISEAEFVNKYTKLPVGEGKCKRGRRCPSYARNQYRYLKRNYTFIG